MRTLRPRLLRALEHTYFNRRSLGFDQDDQIYGIEFSEAKDVLVQAFFGPGRAESIIDDDGGGS